MITMLYAGLLGLFFFYLSIETIKARRSNQVSIGPGKNDEIGKIVAAHGNFSSYTAFFLVALGYVESSTTVAPVFIHLLGAGFTLGRILHYKAFAGKMNFTFRKSGMHLTLWPLLIISIILISYYLKPLVS